MRNRHKDMKLPRNLATLIEKIRRVEDDLNTIIIARSRSVHLAMLAVISGSNLIILGPPGVAKTMLLTELANRFNARLFARLLTRYTTEDDLFYSHYGLTNGTIRVGAMSLKAQRIIKSTANMLPESDIVFLDEFFKARAVLPSLLTVMNERVLYVEGRPQPIQARCFFAASNENGNGDDVTAIYDRFLLRDFAFPLVDADIRIVLTPQPVQKLHNIRVSLQEIELVQTYASQNTILSSSIIDMLIELKQKLSRDFILYISDRRMKKTLQLAKVHAVLAGRNEVTFDDLAFVFPHIAFDTGTGKVSGSQLHSIQEAVTQIVGLSDGSVSWAEIDEIRRTLQEFRTQSSVVDSDQSTDHIKKFATWAIGSQAMLRKAMERLSERDDKHRSILNITEEINVQLEACNTILRTNLLRS